VRFYTKNDRFAFLSPPFEGLRGNIQWSSWAYWKAYCSHFGHFPFWIPFGALMDNAQRSSWAH